MAGERSAGLVGSARRLWRSGNGRSPEREVSFSTRSSDPDAVDARQRVESDQQAIGLKEAAFVCCDELELAQLVAREYTNVRGPPFAGGEHGFGVVVGQREFERGGFGDGQPEPNGE